VNCSPVRHRPSCSKSLAAPEVSPHLVDARKRRKA
jgi:hypothetical protein